MMRWKVSDRCLDPGERPMGGARTTCGVLVLCATTLVNAHVASADAPSGTGAALVQIVDDECFDRAELARALDAGLTPRPDQPSVTFEFQGRIEHPTLRLARPDGEVVQLPVEGLSADCAIRKKQVVKKIDIALSEEACHVAPPAAVLPPLAAVPPPVSSFVPRTPPETTAIPPVLSPRRGLAAAAGGLVLAGVFPSIGAGGAATVELSLGNVFDLRVGVLAAQTSGVQVGQGRADVWLAAGRVDGCAGFGSSSLRLRSCAGLLLGALGAEARGFAPSLSPRLLWAALPIRTEVTVRLSRWLGIWAGIDALVVLTSDALVVRDGDVTVASTTPSPAGLAAGAGPMVFFSERARKAHWEAGHGFVETERTRGRQHVG